MAFVPVLAGKGIRRYPTIGNGPTHLIVYPGPKLISELGWEQKGMVSLAIGEDDDSGWIRLTASKKGFSLNRMHSGDNCELCLRLPKTHFPEAPNPKRIHARPDTVTYRLDGDALLLRLPWDVKPASSVAAPKQPATGAPSAGAAKPQPVINEAVSRAPRPVTAPAEPIIGSDPKLIADLRALGATVELGDAKGVLIVDGMRLGIFGADEYRSLLRKRKERQAHREGVA